MANYLLMGSGEFEPWSHEPEAAALAMANGNGSVAILPTASSREGDEVFERWGSMGLAHYSEVGIPAEVIPIKIREDALRNDLAARIEAASMVFVSGGKPRHLAAVMAGTPSWTAVLDLIDRGGVYAGCSAGAMVASQWRGAHTKLASGWLFGLGLIDHVSFGVHWDRASKLPGINRFAVSRIPDHTWFVGIDERTAIVGDGTAWEIHGGSEVRARSRGVARIHGVGERFETPRVDPPMPAG